MADRRPLALVDSSVQAPVALVDEARALRRDGKIPAAMALLERLFAQYPNDARVWHEQAHLFMTLREYRRAKVILEQVAQATGYLQPQPLYQIGVICEREGLYAESILWYQKALRAGRHYGPRGLVLTYSGLRSAHARLGHTQDVKDYTKRIMLMAKQHQARDILDLGDGLDVHGQYSASLTALAEGQWELGWELFEARNELPEHRADRRNHKVPDRARPAKKWDGKAQERVVVFAEQGTGDTIQYARYLPMVTARSGHPVTAVVQDQLVDVLSDLYRDTLFVGEGSVRTNQYSSDSHCWLMSLPHLLGGGPPPPHGTAPPHWRGSEAGHTIGVCWHGERSYANDRDRSAPSRDTLWFPLQLAGWTVRSLQYGEDFDLNYQDTARYMREELDAVVSVDTSMAHLAGALDVPTIMLAQTVPDHRAPPASGTVSPWYESWHVLRRQRTGPEEWARAMDRAVVILREWL